MNGYLKSINIALIRTQKVWTAQGNNATANWKHKDNNHT